MNVRRRRYDLVKVDLEGWEPPRTQCRVGPLAVWEELGTAKLYLVNLVRLCWASHVPGEARYL